MAGQRLKRLEGLQRRQEIDERRDLRATRDMVHAPLNALAGGALSASGEEISRYRARNTIEGFAGPSFGIGADFFEGSFGLMREATGTGNMTERDWDRITRPIPGNNLWYLLPLLETASQSQAN